MNIMLETEKIKKIDSIFSQVHMDGRNQLFEHEVYWILEIIGLRAPAYHFVTNPEQVNDEVLSKFGSSEVILKVVSKDIPHKGKVGGIKKLIKDRDFIKYMMKKMKEDISNHVSFDIPPKISGFLITNYVDYTAELGNELLIGIKENIAFGPVISFSKGGNDAEHFAKHYSKPNLRLVPLTREECEDLIKETKIYLKYCEQFHLDYAQKIADAIFKFNQLAFHYSNFNIDGSKFVITELEVNPFVFDREGNLVAVDGLAYFMIRDTDYKLSTQPNLKNLEYFFKPNGIAVVGVSTSDMTKIGNIIATLLHNMNREDLYFVNVKGGEVKVNSKKYPIYKTLMDIKENIDLVIITVPARFTPTVMEECKKKKVKSVILIPGGFSEVKGETTLEEQILKIVEGTDIRIIGPNCVGVFYSPEDDNHPGLNTIFIPKEKWDLELKPKRNVALITQSGGMGISQLDKLKNALTPHVIVSYGNQLDVDTGDLMAYFEKDPQIDVIALYIEGFKPFGGREFFNAAKGIGKPIIVYKAGRTDAGSRAAASHTASMTGDYEVAKAAFLQSGCIVTEGLIDHKDLIKTWALMGGKKVRGNKVAGVVNAGFESTYAADSLGNLELAEFSAETVRKLKEIMPPFVCINTIMDLTPMAGDEVFEKSIEYILADDNVDALFLSIVPHTPQLHTTAKELKEDKENIANRIIRQNKNTDKPIVVSVNAGSFYNTFVEILENGGIPTFTTARRAMLCLNRLISYKLKNRA